MIGTYSQMHRVDKYLKHSSIIYIKIGKSINKMNNLFVSVEAKLFTNTDKLSLAKGKARPVITFFT